MFGGIKNTKDFFIDILFPAQCIICEKEGEWLCHYCQKKISFYHCLNCIICHKEAQEESILCPACASFYGFKNIIAVTDYKNKTVANTIKYLKYNFIKELSVYLADIVQQYVEQEIKKDNLLYKYFNSKNSLLIPVPLHSKKLKRRGFNQTIKIFKKISERFDIPLDCNLHRIKNKKPQTKLSGSERERNLKNCFVWKGKNLSSYNIILVDDVITTGATMFECASTLKTEGAKNILGLAVAHG